MSSLLRFQQEEAKKEQEAQKLHFLKKNTLLYRFADSLFLLLLSTWLIISFYLINSNFIEKTLFALLSILVISALSFIWLTIKLKININKKLVKQMISFKKIYLFTIIFSNLIFYFISNFIYISLINDPMMEKNLILLYLVISLIFLSGLFYDLYLLSSSKELENLYLIDFLKNQMKILDPKKENVSMNFLSLIGIFFLFPLILFFIYFQRIDYTFFVYLSSLTIILMGYWNGYGFYRSYRWVQGYDSTIDLGIIDQFDFKTISSIIFSIMSSLLIFFLMILFLLINSSLVAIDYYSRIILFIILIFIFASQILKVSNIENNNNKKNTHLTITIFLLIPLIIPVFAFMFSKNSDINFLNNLTNDFSLINLLFVFLFAVSIIITYITYRHKLNTSMWTDRYEAGQILNEINLSLNSPKITQLNLLTKLGLAQKDPTIIMKLMAIYENLLSNKKITPEILDTIHTFLLFEIEYANEWNVHAIAFDLINQLLEYESKFYLEYYNKAKKISNHKNELVRQANLNLLGHLLHIDGSLANEIYPIALEVYHNSSDEMKKNNIEPLKYYASNFPEYREKLYTFVIERIEKEYFGVSTELMGIIEIITDSDKSFFDRTMTLCKDILRRPDSNAGLGAIRILVNNFPNNPKNGVPIIKIMIEYLKDGLPEVKHHIIYNLGTIIKKIPSLSVILEDLDFAFYDDDPNVRSALIQVVSDLYPFGNIPEEMLSFYLQNGIGDHDYIVRLVSIQQINNLLKTTPFVLKHLPVYLEISLKDSNSDVFEEAYSIFQNNFVYLQNNFPKWVRETGLDSDRIKK